MVNERCIATSASHLDGPRHAERCAPTSLARVADTAIGPGRPTYWTVAAVPLRRQAPLRTPDAEQSRDCPYPAIRARGEPLRIPTQSTPTADFRRWPGDYSRGVYFTDRGIEELAERRGDEQVTLSWLADRLRAFVDQNPDFETAVDRLATFLARDDTDADD
jgi:Family of unknown function (DUF6104)